MSGEVVSLRMGNPVPMRKSGIAHFANNGNAAAWLTAAAASFLSNQLDVQTTGGLSVKVRKTSILRQSSISYDTQSPPSSPPGAKKNVRFADTIGLELESIKFFVESPKIPRRHSTGTNPNYNKIVFHNSLSSEPVTKSKKKSLVPINFVLPSLQPDFSRDIEARTVLLHSVTTSETTVYGIVAVKNQSFQKKVFIRYTTNDWNDFKEVEGQYMVGSHENNTDKFHFTIYAKSENFANGASNFLNARLCFAIRYESNDTSYWDNNEGRNYCLNYYEF